MQKVSSIRPARSVAAGFLFMVLLVVVLACVSLYAVDRVDKHAEHVMQDQRTRLDQLYTLRNIIHERILLMTWAMLDTDPFRRDEYYEKFLELGNRFIEVRVQIDSMLLSREEASEMASFRDETMRIAPLVDDIFLHMLEKRSEQANAKLVERLVPAQAEILTKIERVIALVQDKHQVLQTQARQSSRLAFLLTAILGLTAVLLAALTGWHATHRVSTDRMALIGEVEVEVRQSRQ